MPNPFDGTASKTNPLASNPAAAGPGAIFFKLTTSHNNTLVDGTPVATPALPYTIRVIRCVADGTIDVQDAVGNVHTLTMVAKEVHDLGYIRAVSGVVNDKFVAYT